MKFCRRSLEREKHQGRRDLGNSGKRDEQRAYIAASPPSCRGGAIVGQREGGREEEIYVYDAATQQFRVKCYVSESVMPMWAEANLWNPVSAHM